ncbi:MAG TPA: glycosyltransferase [Methylomirabilota bacterium]|nr:glycosyltransferase [Methylomirabilota bacterium]
MPVPVRILELLVSTDLGGGPAQVRDVVTRLPREEFAVTVAGPSGSSHGGVLAESGARVVGIGTDRIGRRPFLDVLELIRVDGIDIVHSHGKGAGLYGRLAARRAGIPAVHTFHGIHARYPVGGARAYLMLERALARITAAIVHVSESQALEAAALGLAPPGRTHVIVNGIDARCVAAGAMTRAAAREKLRLEPDALVLGTVARFDPVKALDSLLRAFALAAAQYPAARLVLVGDGPAAPRLRALSATLGIEARVRLAGPIAHASRLLPALDLYVSASRKEGLPLALLEAMACGLPVAATRVPGHVDVVAEGVTGLLAAPHDHGDLARAMRELMTEQARRSVMGQAGRRRVEDRFGASRMAAETAALYRSVAARFARGR